MQSAALTQCITKQNSRNKNQEILPHPKKTCWDKENVLTGCQRQVGFLREGMPRRPNKVLFFVETCYASNRRKPGAKPPVLTEMCSQIYGGHMYVYPKTKPFRALTDFCHRQVAIYETDLTWYNWRVCRRPPPVSLIFSWPIIPFPAVHTGAKRKSIKVTNCYIIQSSLEF